MTKHAKAIQKLYQTGSIQSKEIVNSVRLNIREDKVTLANGKEKTYHIVTHPGACAILPITKEGHILFVKQYRHAPEDILLEIPAGVIDPNEEAATCAKRELREEIGMNAKEIKLLMTFLTTPGFTNEKIYLFIANNLFHDPLIAEDSDEIDIVSYPLDEALKMIDQGKITDAKTIIALLHYKLKKGEIAQ